MSIYILLSILLVVAFVAGFSMWKKKEQNELFRLFQIQADKRGGRVKPGSLLYYPKLTIPQGGVEFTASALLGGGAPDRGAATTYVSFPLVVPPGNDFRIRKRTKSVQTLLNEKLYGPPIKTGDPAFDDSFVAQSRNTVTTRGFLTDEMRSRLLAFAETVDVRFEKNLFIVTVDDIVKGASTLEKMLDLAALAHGSLRYLGHGSSGRAGDSTRMAIASTEGVS